MYYVRSLKREILNLIQLFKSFNMNTEYFDKFNLKGRAVWKTPVAICQHQQ